MAKQIENRLECINYESFLDQVANELSFNYVSVSFGETHKDGLIHGIDKPSELYQNIFKDAGKLIKDRGNEKKCRNILVIGSGASHDSYACIPLGSETKYLLGKQLNLQSLLSTNKEFKEKFEDEAKRILSMRLGTVPDKSNGPVIDHPKFDFESYLLLMTKFFREQDIRKALHKMFNLRHAPCLFYEITAHLFKHRFFDVIINFNFDELLDQAIKEEMGSADFHTIISDGDCKDIQELIVDGRLKIPVYIKPHGTISHKSTLRFTKDHYFDLPDDIKQLLEELMEGQLTETSKDIERINVVTVGFNLDSIEFNDIIKKNKERVKIFSITYSDKPALFIEEDMQYEKTLFKDGEYLRLLPTIFGRGSNQKEKESLSLGAVFSDLFEKISGKFNELYKPRSITRHLIVNDIFYRDKFRIKDKKDNPIVSYRQISNTFSKSFHFKNRAIIELAIALARGRGRIELKELMTDRLGEVYKLYRKFHQQEKYIGLPDSLYDLAEIFKLKEEYSFSRNVHNISKITTEESESPDFEEIINLLFSGKKRGGSLTEDELADYPKCIVFRLLTAKQTPSDLHDCFLDKSGKYDQILISKIVKYFKILYETGYYQDVNARFNDPRLYIFDHYYMDQILHTSLSYSYRFNEVFLVPDHWDYLFFVSDTGSILERLFEHIKDKNSFRGKKIYLISCLEAIKKDTGKYSRISNIVKNRTDGLHKYTEIGCEVIHQTLPYSDHHHHLSIFLKKVPVDNLEHKSIYELSKFPTIQVTKQEGGIENYIFSRSIYFYQKGFNSEINPLWVRGAFAFLKDKNVPSPSNFATNLLVKDHLMLLETFYAYHKKSLSFFKSDGEHTEYLLPKHFDLGDSPSSKLKQRIFDIGSLFAFMDSFGRKGT